MLVFGRVSELILCDTKMTLHASILGQEQLEKENQKLKEQLSELLLEKAARKPHRSWSASDMSNSDSERDGFDDDDSDNNGCKASEAKKQKPAADFEPSPEKVVEKPKAASKPGVLSVVDVSGRMFESEFALALPLSACLPSHPPPHQHTPPSCSSIMASRYTEQPQS